MKIDICPSTWSVYWSNSLFLFSSFGFNSILLFQTGSIDAEGQLVYEKMIEGLSPQKSMTKSLLFTCPSSGRSLRHQSTHSLLGAGDPAAASSVSSFVKQLPSLTVASPAKQDPENPNASKLLLASGDVDSKSVTTSLSL